MPTTLVDNQRNSIQSTGIGLRSVHYPHILNNLPNVPWFEVLTDNYLNSDGLALEHLQQVAEHYPCTFHGVGLSLGSTSPLSYDYLKQLKALKEYIKPAWISDHLSWSRSDSINSHDLLPMPYTDEAIQHLSNRIKAVQDYMGEQILIENVSSYLNYDASYMTESEFLNTVIEQADCALLLDINNIIVSATNHNFSASDYLNSMPFERVKEMHLAGYEKMDGYLLDTHGARVFDDVWALFSQALSHLPNVPVLIEWDTNIPDFSVLQEEAEHAERIRKTVKDNVA